MFIYICLSLWTVSKACSEVLDQDYETSQSRGPNETALSIFLSFLIGLHTSWQTAKTTVPLSQTARWSRTRDYILSHYSCARSGAKTTDGRGKSHL